MTYEEILESYAMKYWSLPNGSSTAQTKRLEKAINGSDYFLTKKRDGAFYRFGIKDKDYILQSRTMSVKTKDWVQKQDNVPSIMEVLSTLPSETILLGEICFKGVEKTSKEVVSIMGCLPTKSIARQAKTPVEYYIFDILMFDGKDLTGLEAESRIKYIDKVKELINSPLISYVEVITENIPETISQWLSEGEEGGVLTEKKGTYDARLDKHGKPSWRTIKVKQEMKQTLDLVVMSILPATREYQGKYPTTHKLWFNIVKEEKLEGSYYGKGGQYIAVSEDFFYDLPSSVRLGAWYDGKLIEVCRVSGLKDSLKIDLRDNPEKYLEKVVMEVGGMSIDTVEKTLRHPKLVQIREDKQSLECQYTDIFA